MPYRRISNDFKLRTVDLLDNHGAPRKFVSDVFAVSKRSTYRWQKHFRDGGVVYPTLQASRGRSTLLTPTVRDAVFEILQDDPTVYLDEISDWLNLVYEISIPLNTLSRHLVQWGHSRALVHRIAAERDPAACEAFLRDMQANFRREQMVWVDESAKDERTLFRRYGRSLPGERAHVRQPIARGERFTLLPALTEDGYMAFKIFEGAVDGVDFLDFVVNDVLPNMGRFPAPKSILVMDNCAIHKSKMLAEAVEENGSLLLFIPPYSPQLNPIEESFSAIKYWLKRHWRELQDEDPQGSIHRACDEAITAEKAKAWITHSGYQ